MTPVSAFVFRDIRFRVGARIAYARARVLSFEMSLFGIPRDVTRHYREMSFCTNDPTLPHYASIMLRHALLCHMGNTTPGLRYKIPVFSDPAPGKS